ncbi:MAG: DUF1835 domain-containing protein [Chitinophagales bacterium]|nr:DUF1835 domain-containing protein [Chitinophagales bacterium]
MTYHILNGDCLADQLKQTNIQGQFIICAECLVDGDLTGDTLSQYWTTRAKFISFTYNTAMDDYYNKCVIELEKIINLPDTSEVCLWFENDLFCQTNMWFILSLLSKKQVKKIFRVFPIIDSNIDLWKGFGISNTQMLEQAYNSKIPFTSKDIKLGDYLWNAYKISDFKKLKELSRQESYCFQHLDEVCQAHIDRFPTDNSLGRPDKIVKEIIENKSEDFQVVFSNFSERQGIYGFGDLQVKNIYDRQFSGTK